MMIFCKHFPKSRRPLLAMGLALLLAWLLPTSPAVAAPSVTVTVPTFAVTLNGRTMDSTYSQYPLLVYNDITYFPMTYYDSRLLGVQTQWTAERGLHVTKADDYCFEYLHPLQAQKNAASLTARLADGSITVNGTPIDNTKEEYPLLVFRDVTYFPLTWRFAAEEFGWDYAYTEQDGLTITNIAVKQEDPDTPWSNELSPFSSGAGSMSGGDELDFPIRFIDKQATLSLNELDESANRLSAIGLSLYNYFSGHDVTIAPMAQWEYQVYRLTDNGQTLLYWRKFPFYADLLPQHNVIHSQYIPTPLLSGGYIQPGTYLVQLVPSGELVYEETDTQQTKRVDLKESSVTKDGSNVGFYLSGTITVTP